MKASRRLALQSCLCLAAFWGAVTSVQAGLYDAWNYRSKISFPLQVNETLTNFPVLVVLSTGIRGFSYAEFQSPIGGDLRFADAGEISALDYEIEKWNTRGSSYVWVKVPALAGTNDFIYAYWGNSDTNPPSGSTNGAAWSDGEVCVLHMTQTNGMAARDSTTNRYDATLLAGTSSEWTPGVAGNGVTFSGAVGNYLNIAAIATAPFAANKATLMVWVKMTQTNTPNAQAGFARVLGDSGGPGNCLYDYISGGTTSAYPNVFRNGNRLGPLPLLNSVSRIAWHLVTISSDYAGGAGRWRMYQNGIEITNVAANTLNLGITNVRIGSGYEGVGELGMLGSVDEVRIANVARGSNWINACWLTVASNSAFVNCETVQRRQIAGVFRDWFYRAQLSFPRPLSGTLLDFPLLVTLGTNIPKFNYNQFRSPSGGDLRFADAQENAALNYEIERWATNGNSLIWVRVPVIGNSNDFIYAYWGGDTNPPPCTTNGATWADSDICVLHLGQTNGLTAYDSTTNHIDAALTGMAGTEWTPGIIGNGVSLNGSGQYLWSRLSRSPFDATFSGTLLIWVKLVNATPVAGKNGFVSLLGYGGSDLYPHTTGYAYESVLRTDRQGPITLLGSVVRTNWHLVAITSDFGPSALNGTVALWKMYQNGMGVTNYLGKWPAVNYTNAYIGADRFQTPESPTGAAASPWLEGSVDDVRISNIARDSNWVYACWLNVASNSVFPAYGPANRTTKATVFIMR